MRTLTKTVYTVRELSPEAFERARQKYADFLQEVPWMDEIMDSLKTCVNMAGLTLRDWSVGPHSRGTFCQVKDFGGAELTGARAMAWLENNLLSALRIPWAGKDRWSVAKYGPYYRPGLVKPCPLTGYCADEEMIDSLRLEIRGGRTVKEAFENLANVAARLMEQEIEHATSAEGFRETAEANDWEFDEDGDMV